MFAPTIRNPDWSHGWMRRTCGTIRAKLLKLGARITVSVRRVKLALASACPSREAFTIAAERLRRAIPPPGPLQRAA
jgi:hypothetical protein